MSTTKAYLAGLGTTGILIGSVVVLMVLGTGIVAFDGLPELGSSHRPLERVVVDDETLGDGPGDSAGRKDRSARRLPAGAAWYAPPSRRPLDEQRRGAILSPEVTGRRPARRRSHGHGGAQVRAGERLGGGASAGNGGAGETGNLSRGSEGSRGRRSGHAARNGGGGATAPSAPSVSPGDPVSPTGLRRQRVADELP
jgi:hypothetical protein